MDCAPFKKPSRKAGLFSYRSVIPPSPHETLLAQSFMGAPAARWAAIRGLRIACGGFLQKSPRAHSAAPPSPHEALLRKVSWGPPPLRGRQSASGAPPAAAFCFVFRPLLDRGGRICYADSQIIRKESVTHKTMDDGDSTEGENPPLPHIQSFIGHSLCLRE